jgi:ankyrin repeat protein
MWSGVNQYSEIFDLLEKQGFDPTIDRDGITLLSHAFRNGDLRLVQASRRYRHRIPLHAQVYVCTEACRSGQCDFLREFLENWNLSVDATNSEGQSLLWIAVAESKI